MHLTITRVAVAAPLLLLLGACGTTASSEANTASTADTAGSSASSGTVRPGLPQPAVPSAKSAVGSSGSSGSSPVSSATGALSRSVVSTGQISLHASQVTRARDEILGLVASWGGMVASEQTSSDDRGRIDGSQLILRVPTAQFATAMRRLVQIGHVDAQSSRTDDVTTQVIDVQARIRSGEASIRAIQKLLDRATQLGDIVTIESDLARRQAELDSLTQQAAWLDDQTSLSTIEVSLARTVPPAPKKVVAHGFLAGLGAGWTALGAMSVVVLTVLGAALPFAALVALVGAPLVVVVRRRRTSAPPPAEA